MAVGDIQTSFAAGELSPQLYARVDLDKFQVGAALLRNFFVDYRGGVSNRAGTEYIDTTVAGARTIPFVVSTAAAYVLLFSNELITIYNFGVLVTTVATPYATEHLFEIQYTQSADVLTLTHPLYPPADLSRTSDITFDYAAVATGPDIDPPVITTMRAPHSETYTYGYVVTAVDADGKEESLASNIGTKLSLVLDEGVNQVIGLTWDAPPQAVSKYNTYKWGPNDNATMSPSTTWGFIGSSVATTFTDNNIAPDFSKQPPAWGDPFSGGQFASITVTNGGSGYASTSQFPDIPFVPLDITGDGTGAAGYAVVDNATHSIIGVYLTNSGKNYTHATITAVGDGGTGATFDFTFTDPTPLYPAATAYLQQRRVFGGSNLKPETLVLSQPGLINNFNTTPITLPSDAITMSIAAEEVNTIKSFVQVAYGLIAFTTGGSFLINGGSPGAPIDANSPSIQPQVSQGANGLRPIRINYDVIYGQAKGNRIHNLAFAWQKQSYAGTDISTLAAHLFDTYLTVDWAYAEEPFKIVWAVRSDGKLLSLTYVPDQDVYAWCRHDTQGLFKSVCTVPEGNNDAVYVVVERFVDNVWVYYLERMHERQGCCIYDAWFLDSALALANPTLPSPLYVKTTSPTTVEMQTYAPFTTPAGDFGGLGNFSPITGLLGFDTSLGGDGNGMVIMDWDRGVFFTSVASTGASATWDITTGQFIPPQLATSATTGANDGIVPASVDSEGNWYLGQPSGAISKIAHDLSSKTDTILANVGFNCWTMSHVEDQDVMVTVGSNNVTVVNVTNMVTVAEMLVDEEQAFCGTRTNVENEQWVVGTSRNFGTVFNNILLPFGFYKVTLGDTGASMVRKFTFTPANLGWTNFASYIQLLGDETDGNPLCWADTNTFAAWNGATVYSDQSFVSFIGHDWQSLQNPNTGNQPDTSPTFWLDLGASATTNVYLFKLNAEFGNVMWKIPVGASVRAYIQNLPINNRIRYGRYRFIEPNFFTSLYRRVFDVDTLTGAFTTTLIWNFEVDFNYEMWNDKTGAWFGKMNTVYNPSDPNSPVPQFGTPNAWGGWAFLGDNPFQYPISFPTNIGAVVQIDCGKVEITSQTAINIAQGLVLAPLEDLVIPDDPNGLLAPVPEGGWTITTPSQVLHGLEHLENKEVWALADGQVVGPLTVESGSVDLGFEASSVVVGLKYTSQIQTLYLTTEGIQQGSDQGKRKQISGITLRVDCSRGLKAGTDFGDFLTPIPELNDPNSNDLFIGDCRVLSYPQWDERGFTMIQQDLPLPATVLGVVVEVTPGDDGS